MPVINIDVLLTSKKNKKNIAFGLNVDLLYILQYIVLQSCKQISLLRQTVRLFRENINIFITVTYLYIYICYMLAYTRCTI